MSDTPKRAISPGDSTEDSAKRAKFNSESEPKPIENLTYPHTRPGNETIPAVVSKMGLKPILPVMPPSLELVTGVKADLRVRKGFVGQEEVGILGYAGDPAFKGVRGVIKQRFTDFLVNEVGLDGEVLRLKSIGKPVDPYDVPRDRTKGKEKEKEEPKAEPEATAPVEVKAEVVEEKKEVVEEKKEAEPETDEDLPENLRFKPLPLWTANTTRTLRPVFSDECIAKLYALLVEGKEPPPKVDSGWGSRKARVEVASGNEEAAMNVDGMREEEAPAPPSMYGDRGGGRGQGRDRGRGRGGRGGRGGGRAGDNGQWANATKDDREVLSQQMTREDRTKAHQVIREVFKGTFETSAKEIPGEENQRIALKWSKGGPATRRPEKPKDTSDRPKPPPYIHFTLHKTNRDTQDCLSHLSRALGCKPQDLSVCGTKDKRAVTVQRVCFKRSGKNLVGVWRTANGIRPGRRTEQQAVEERGERGSRIGDLEYSDKYLELGMLKGNHFAITLRSVQSEASREEIDAHLLNIRTKGFVNFYGMQRFGTSTVPTHITGLFILQSKWSEAVDSILSLREGEHPECVRARLAWLEDEDLEGALQLMPRRCVAERSIWEHWRRSDRKDKLGALGTIPRNLRTMYVHAYQSYIWNLVTSERIKLSSTEPLVGDLVFADKSADDEVVDESSKGWKPSHANSSSQEVKQLTEEDLGNYTIHDVIMPLPGWNINYPAGDIGELYTNILKEDGLDPKRMQRDQREYSLPGSYRKIIHLPKTFTWSHVSYTDPDISLVQSDEDKILGENPAAEDDPEGKFQALKIELTLGPSAYATMALREITREETSTWHQIGLTMKGEDQEFKGAAGPGPEAIEGEKTEEVKAEEAKSEIKAE